MSLVKIQRVATMLPFLTAFTSPPRKRLLYTMKTMNSLTWLIKRIAFKCVGSMSLLFSKYIFNIPTFSTGNHNP